MGQFISLKSKWITHDLNHDLIFYAHTFNCVCHSIRSMFRVLGIYNFDAMYKILWPWFSYNVTCTFPTSKKMSQSSCDKSEQKNPSNERWWWPLAKEGAIHKWRRMKFCEVHWQEHMNYRMYIRHFWVIFGPNHQDYNFSYGPLMI